MVEAGTGAFLPTLCRVWLKGPASPPRVAAPSFDSEVHLRLPSGDSRSALQKRGRTRPEHIKRTTPIGTIYFTSEHFREGKRREAGACAPLCRRLRAAQAPPSGPLVRTKGLLTLSARGPAAFSVFPLSFKKIVIRLFFRVFTTDTSLKLHCKPVNLKKNKKKRRCMI